MLSYLSYHLRSFPSQTQSILQDQQHQLTLNQINQKPTFTEQQLLSLKGQVASYKLLSTNSPIPLYLTKTLCDPDSVMKNDMKVSVEQMIIEAAMSEPTKAKLLASRYEKDEFR